jgi:hypothetical protein
MDSTETDSWLVTRAFQDGRLPEIPAHLLKPTRVRVLRGFCVGGRPLDPGELTTMPYYAAADMIALRKAELVE